MLRELVVLLDALGIFMIGLLRIELLHLFDVLLHDAKVIVDL